MNITFTFVSQPPEPEPFRALLRAFFLEMTQKLREAGGPDKDPDTLADTTIAGLQDALPPAGRLLLAHDAEGALIGCGALRFLGADAAEFKRMFVAPQARGAGLGQKLMNLRMDEARRAGCQTFYADTVRGNQSMLSLYERAGFRQIPRYEGNANGPEMAPFLVYLRKDLAPAA